MISQSNVACMGATCHRCLVSQVPRDVVKRYMKRVTDAKSADLNEAMYGL